MDRDLELQLVARLRAGEAAAFDQVYDAYNRRLFSFLARLARSRDVAEDLVEEVWLRLVVQRGRLQPDTRFGPWLFTVARNLYLSYCRSRLIEDAHRPDAAAGCPAELFCSPFEATAATEFERQLEMAVAQLPAAYREVLLLVAVEGLRPVEAAAICGISPEAMRQRLSRARALLTQRLDDARRPPVTVPGEVMP